MSFESHVTCASSSFTLFVKKSSESFFGNAPVSVSRRRKNATRGKCLLSETSRPLPTTGSLLRLALEHAPCARTPPRTSSPVDRRAAAANGDVVAVATPEQAERASAALLTLLSAAPEVVCDDELLWLAAAKGYISLVSQLLSAGAVFSLKKASRTKWGPLHAAAQATTPASERACEFRTNGGFDCDVETLVSLAFVTISRPIQRKRHKTRRFIG